MNAILHIVTSDSNPLQTQYVEPCDHPTIVQGFCVICGAQIKMTQQLEQEQQQQQYTNQTTTIGGGNLQHWNGRTNLYNNNNMNEGMLPFHCCGYSNRKLL